MKWLIIFWIFHVSAWLLWLRTHAETVFLIRRFKFKWWRVLLHGQHTPFLFHRIDFLSWYSSSNVFYKKSDDQIIWSCNNTIRTIEFKYTCIDTLKLCSNKFSGLCWVSKKKTVADVEDHVKIYESCFGCQAYQRAIKNRKRRMENSPTGVISVFRLWMMVIIYSVAVYHNI